MMITKQKKSNIIIDNLRDGDRCACDDVHAPNDGDGRNDHVRGDLNRDDRSRDDRNGDDHHHVHIRSHDHSEIRRRGSHRVSLLYNDNVTSLSDNYTIPK